MLRTFLVGAAGLAAATVALAQSQPGAGSPAAPNGEPYAPNASVAPSAMPNGGAMGTQSNSATNLGQPSADQGDQSQTPQPGMTPSTRSGTHRSRSGTSSTSPGNSSTPPSGMAPPSPTTPPQ